MIIFVHFYFPFSVHCYIIIYSVQGMKNYLEQADKIIYYLLDINSNKLDFIIGGDLTVDMVSGEIIEREEEGSFENFKLELKENSYVEAKVN